MSSYWAELPLKINSGSEALKLPKLLTRFIIEVIAAQNFGILLNSVGINFSAILPFPFSVILIFLINYVIFVIFRNIVAHFDYVPLPSFTDKENEKFVKTIIFPISATLIFFGYGAFLMVLIVQFSTVLSFRWVSFLYAYLINIIFMLFVDQFSRISYLATGSPSKHFNLFKVTSFLLFIAILLLLSVYYLGLMNNYFKLTV